MIYLVLLACMGMNAYGLSKGEPISYIAVAIIGGIMIAVALDGQVRRG